MDWRTFSDKQLLLIFLKIYDCQSFRQVRVLTGWLSTMFRLQEKDDHSISLEVFIKNGQWRKQILKKLPAFWDYGNQLFKNDSSNSLSLLTTGKCIYKAKQTEVLLTRKGSRHQRNSMEASQRRAQTRNENLKALERIAYRKGKIGTEETMSTIS